jgi:hypothetical protein
MFNLTVADIIPPSITCPSDIAIELSTGANQAVSWPSAQVSDNLGEPTLTYSVEPGSSFDLGQHSVTATATDSAGNTASCAFRVWLVDIAAPVVTCPSDVEARADNDGAQVTFPSAQAIDNSGTVILTYSTESGSTFSPGSSTVTVTASDPAGNHAQCSFEVRVLAPSEEPDAGPGTGDAGSDEEDAPSSSSGSGCACSTTASTGSWDLSMLLMLLTLGLRRLALLSQRGRSR